MTPDGYFAVVSWDEFQHYKDRDPPWIKLHRRLLDNYGWGSLCDASKAHLVGVWLLAARYDNKIPNDAVWVGQRIGAHEPVDLAGLQEAGFIETWEPNADGAGKRERWPTRHIKKAVKEAVWERDKGKCRQCGERDHMLIEYDHVVPISRGGEGTAENLQLLCRSCNRRKRNTLRPAEQLAPQSLGQSAVLRSPEAEAEGEPEREKEKNGEAADAARTVNPLSITIPAARRWFWVPDGKPPKDWSVEREASIHKRLFDLGNTPEAVAAVIEGARLLADRGEVPWLKRGHKLTARVLYHTHSGVLPLWTLAETALHAHQNAPQRAKSRPVLLGDTPIQIGPQEAA